MLFKHIIKYINIQLYYINIKNNDIKHIKIEQFNYMKTFINYNTLFQRNVVK